MERLRMCVCCRNHFDKKELVRVVKNKEGEIFIDYTGKSNGRGAYICKNRDCFDKLKSKKCLNRAFKCEVPKNVYESLEGELFE